MRNSKKWTEIEGDFDHRVRERILHGRMTHKRYKIIERYCRKNSYYTPACGHEWDCCGCVTSVIYKAYYTRVASNAFKVSVKIWISYNF